MHEMESVELQVVLPFRHGILLGGSRRSPIGE
jgi:hypothetical protein